MKLSNSLKPNFIVATLALVVFLSTSSFSQVRKMEKFKDSNSIIPSHTLLAINQIEQFVYQNIQYDGPYENGSVEMQLSIAPNGSLYKIIIIPGANHALEEAVLRTLRSMGRVNVRSTYRGSPSIRMNIQFTVF